MLPSNPTVNQQLSLSRSACKRLLQIAFIFLSLIAKGQTDFRPGYYINLENDTIHGLVDFRGAKRNSDHCLFKATENSEPVLFQPTEISGYRFSDSKYYVSKKIEIEGTEKQVFLEFLVNGITDIYYHTGQDHPRYFIEHKSGKLIELSNELKDEYIEGEGNFRRESKKYIGILKATLADCPEVQGDIDRAELNHKSLISIGKKYNKYVCDEECIVYEKQVPALKFRIAPVVGFNMIKLSFPENNYFNNGVSYSEFDFNYATTPSVGFVLNTSIPQLNEKLSLDIGASVYQFQTDAGSQSEPDYIIDVYDAHLNFTSLQTKIALKYTFPKGVVRPTMAIGIASNFFLSKSQIVTVKTYFNDREISSIERSDYFPIVTDLHGLYGELGSDFIVKNRRVFYSSLNFSLMGNYKGNYGNTDVSGIKTKLVNTNICFGMYLGKTNK